MRDCTYDRHHKERALGPDTGTATGGDYGTQRTRYGGSVAVCRAAHGTCRADWTWVPAENDGTRGSGDPGAVVAPGHPSVKGEPVRTPQGPFRRCCGPRPG